MKKINKAESEIRGIIKGLTLGQTIPVEIIKSIKYFHSSVREMFKQKLDRHGWGLQSPAQVTNREHCPEIEGHVAKVVKLDKKDSFERVLPSLEERKEMRRKARNRRKNDQ